MANREFYNQYLSVISNRKTNLYYDWNQKLIIQQTRDILKRCKNSNQLTDINNLHLNLIYQSTYFSSISNVLEQFFVRLFDQMIYQVREKAISGNENKVVFEKEIKVSQIAKSIDKTQIKNYKNFHNFIDILKQAIGHITIRIGSFNSFYQPPLEWTSQKIRIMDRNYDPLGDQIDKAGEAYKKYMLVLTNKISSLNQKYKKIKQNILQLQDFGTIQINSKYFTNEREEFKSSVITHEFQHFLDYLIKINAQNWDIGRMYRSHSIHNDFQMDTSDIEYKNYYLDQLQFKQMAQTSISQLKILFNRTQLKKIQQNINMFLEKFLYLCEIPEHFYNQKIQQKVDIKITSILLNHFYFNDIKQFFKYTYQDSLKEDNNNTKSNRWNILKKWLYREFLNHF